MIGEFQKVELLTALRALKNGSIYQALDQGWMVDLDVAAKAYYDQLLELSKEELIERIKDEGQIAPTDPRLSMTELVKALKAEIIQQAEEYLARTTQNVHFGIYPGVG